MRSPKTIPPVETGGTTGGERIGPALMLSYDEALARVLAAASLGPLPAENVALDHARGRALAVDVVAPADLPPFANSAVDGFAVRLADTAGASPADFVRLPVGQTIAAGSVPETHHAGGTASRIFTGAPMPSGANGVVMVEDTETLGDGSTVIVRDPGSSTHVRAAGSDIARGSLALGASTTLDAGAIGLLAALGHAHAPCVCCPRVAILTTGDELIAPGAGTLVPGQIFDANGPALAAAVHEAGGRVAHRHHARDSEHAVRDALDACVGSGANLILASGGVSVGDRDYVKTVVQAAGTLDFWRVAIKPGKPLAFGRVGNALFFGLPGNPVSSLVTFELFVRPVLRRLAGHASGHRRAVSALLTAPLSHAPGRREFARARLSWRNDAYHAAPLGAQTSHRLSSLAGADALLIAREDHGDYAAGERLSALLLGG